MRFRRHGLRRLRCVFVLTLGTCIAGCGDGGGPAGPGPTGASLVGSWKITSALRAGQPDPTGEMYDWKDVEWTVRSNQQMVFAFPDEAGNRFAAPNFAEMTWEPQSGAIAFVASWGETGTIRYSRSGSDLAATIPYRGAPLTTTWAALPDPSDPLLVAGWTLEQVLREGQADPSGNDWGLGGEVAYFLFPSGRGVAYYYGLASKDAFSWVARGSLLILDGLDLELPYHVEGGALVLSDEIDGTSYDFRFGKF